LKTGVTALFDFDCRSTCVFDVGLALFYFFAAGRLDGCLRLEPLGCLQAYRNGCVIQGIGPLSRTSWRTRRSDPGRNLFGMYGR
jgi:hypothetical protein